VPYLLSILQRSRRGGGGMRRPAPAPARRPASTYSKPASSTTPAPQQSTVPAPQQSSGGGGMLSGIGSTIAQGMAFGTGSAIAHRAVGAAAGAVSGGGSEEAPEYAQGAMPDQQSQQITGACAQDKEMFYECLKHNKGDQQACQFLYEQLQQCQQSQSQMY